MTALRILTLFAALGITAAPLAAQRAEVRGGDEGARLREAASLENAGELDAAQRTVEAVLAADPQSINALLAYERILTLQRQLPLLLPAVDRMLDVDREAQLAHQMRVRTLSSLDRVSEMERAARAWISATPRIETPYREIARVWRARNEPRRAVQVLEQGRKQIGRPDALALDLGDVFAESGDAQRAVQEWSRAVGPEGQGVLLVQRRLASLPDGGARYVGGFIADLQKEPTTVGRRRAAVTIAVEAGLADAALDAATQLFASLTPREQQPFLVDLARRADGAAVTQVAYWAYGQLVRRGDDRAEASLALRSRFAELALAVGDTAAAATAYRALENALSPGSPERRQAMAVRVGITAREGRLDAAETEFGAFRQEFVRAPETDALAAELAALHLEAGNAEAAERILAGVSGPRSALMRGRVLLRRGETTRARSAFLESAPALRGSEATRTIALVSLLGRISPAGGELLAEAWLSATAGDPAGAVERIMTRSVDLPGEDRAPLLDFAAGVAEGDGLHDHAEQLRSDIIDEHPDSNEAPAAFLAVARAAAARGAMDDAVGLLERLLVEHPRSALAPQARRELDRLTPAAAWR